MSATRILDQERLTAIASPEKRELPFRRHLFIDKFRYPIKHRLAVA